MPKLRNNQTGNAAPIMLALLVVAAVVCAVLVYFQYRKYLAESPVKDSATSTQPAAVQAPAPVEASKRSQSALARNADNTARKNDAATLLANTAQHIADNNGKYNSPPLSELTQGLQYYETVRIAYGNQLIAGQDELVLVLGAICTADKVATMADSIRSYAALYGTKTTNGGFTSACVDV